MQSVLVQAQQTKTELVTLRKFLYFLQHYFNHYICLYLLVFSEECSSLGGTSDGSCASGFGVCCVCKYIYLTLQYIKPFLTFFHYDFLVNTVGLNMPETLKKCSYKPKLLFIPLSISELTTSQNIFVTVWPSGGTIITFAENCNFELIFFGKFF